MADYTYHITKTTLCLAPEDPAQGVTYNHNLVFKRPAPPKTGFTPDQETDVYVPFTLDLAPHEITNVHELFAQYDQLMELLPRLRRVYADDEYEVVCQQLHKHSLAVQLELVQDALDTEEVRDRSDLEATHKTARHMASDATPPPDHNPHSTRTFTQLGLLDAAQNWLRQSRMQYELSNHDYTLRLGLLADFVHDLFTETEEDA